ncbi:MAG: hypothetical protein ACHQHN_08080 [Sphingobacteriales bacterium]
MKILLMLLVLFSGITCRDTTTVYICDSRGAKRYHLTANCRGLSNCSHRIIRMTMDEAKKRGKTLCGWEK